MSKLTGGLTNYYLVNVQHPQREDQQPYQAECEDIAEALQLTPNEFCEFKAIWRTAAARLGNGKPDHKALYDAEKRVHYATRDLVKLRREVESTTTPDGEPLGDGWFAHRGDVKPAVLGDDEFVEVVLADGDRCVGPAANKASDWGWGQKEDYTPIVAWRRRVVSPDPE